MDLTLVSEMLAQGIKTINLLDLQQEQYDTMEKKYQENNTSKSEDSTIKFPLKYVADEAYTMRLQDSGTLLKNELKEENEKESQKALNLQKAFELMEEFKMVVSRKLGVENERKDEYFFRHKKIQDFFIMHKFLSEEKKFVSESNDENFLPLLLSKPDQNDIQANNILIKHIREPKFYGVYLMLAMKLSENSAIKLQKILMTDSIDTKERKLSDAFNKILISRGYISTKS